MFNGTKLCQGHFTVTVDGHGKDHLIRAIVDVAFDFTIDNAEQNFFTALRINQTGIDVGINGQTVINITFTVCTKVSSEATRQIQRCCRIAWVTVADISFIDSDSTQLADADIDVDVIEVVVTANDVFPVLIAGCSVIFHSLSTVLVQGCIIEQDIGTLSS